MRRLSRLFQDLGVVVVALLRICQFFLYQWLLLAESPMASAGLTLNCVLYSIKKKKLYIQL